MWWDRCSFSNESSPFSSLTPSESEIVRGEKVIAMRRTILTRLVNSEVGRIKNNVRNSRLEEMEKSGVLCVGMCHRPPSAISVCCRFLVDGHAKFWIGLHAAEQREHIQRNVKLCRHAPEHERTAPQVMCSPILMLIIWLVLGKGLSCRSGVMAVGFHG